jgi:hypothetical protein
MLINGNGDDIGNGDLGWAPLLAFAAPVAKAAAVAVGTKVIGAVAKKIQGSKPPPPQCTFFQKIGRAFGSNPPCK